MDLQAWSRRTIVELLCERASLHPERVALRFLGDGENVTATLTYAELDQHARAIAVELCAAGPAGERALLLYPSGPAYVCALLGCLYAGWIAVPAYPPESSQPQHLARPVAIARDAQPRLVLTQGELQGPLSAAARFLPDLAQTRVLATDAVSLAQASAWKMPALSADSVAFLQYTSGSTAQPKGVMVGHGNLMANELVIRHAFGMRDDDVVVSWLPLFHDMGLIGTLLQPLFSGVSVVLMGPQHFIERPLRWLSAISRHAGTVSGAPDFAYRLCAERIKDVALPELDLSRWRLAFCGAEPVRFRTLRSFADKLAPVGFDEKALYPCYGLAESSLLVTGGVAGSGVQTTAFDAQALSQNRAVADERGRVLVGCGQEQPGHEVRILDPESGQPVRDGEVGEVVVSGPSVAQGYYRNEEATRQTFVRRGERVALRTGDLGFEYQGQLFITGRHKDLIIVRGHNLYPQDLERTVEDSVEVVRKGRVLAFSAEIGTEERIIVAAEVSQRVQKLVEPGALCSAIGEAVAKAHGEAVAVVLLVNPGGVPITSSGKLQRAMCRKLWQKKTLDTFARHEAGVLVLGGLGQPNTVNA